MEPSLQEVAQQGLKWGAQELPAVIEGKSPAQVDGQILFHPFPYPLDNIRTEVVDGTPDKVGIIAPEVLKKYRDYAGPAEG